MTMIQNKANDLVGLLSSAIEKVAPPPDYTVSEWADRYRKLSSESSAEPGQWRTSRAPYQRGIMDAFYDDKNEQVVVMSSAQVGKSSIIENVVGFYSSQDPAPIMIIQPTLEMAEAFSKDRIAPMVRDTPILREVFGDPKARHSSNTLLHKTFKGGHLTLVGANSPAGLASRPIRILLADEVDRYPLSAGTEGDPINLGIQRTATFHNRRIGMFSTPTVKGISRIEQAFNMSDQRRYFVPCPECGHYQYLTWQRIKWETSETGGVLHRNVWLECESCATKIPHEKKRAMVANGEWRATAEFNGIAGFHINELYSPWRAWVHVVEDFLRAKNSPTTLRVWVNTRLGESWEETGDAVESEDILSRREFYGEADCPEPVISITAGVDVQNDRIEIVVVGWGLDEECWVIDHQVFNGSPEHHETWLQLDDYVSRDITRDDGVIMSLDAVCIDSGAFTQSVYDYVSSRPGKPFYAVKGLAGNGKPIVSKGKVTKAKSGRNFQLYIVGTDEAKMRVMQSLQVQNPGPHYFHLPLAWWCDQEFAEQLTAEQLFRKFKAGQPYYQWSKRRDRNEILDCVVYALSALYIAHKGRHIQRFREIHAGEKPKKVKRSIRSKGIQ